MVDIAEDLIGEGFQLVPESETTYNLLAGVLIESIDSHAVTDLFSTASNVTFNINGLIRAEQYPLFLQGGGGHQITLGTTGRTLGISGIVLEDTADASITNGGSIIVDGYSPTVNPIGNGIMLAGSIQNISVTNSSTGTIITRKTGIAVLLGSDNVTVVNDGLIVSQGPGMYYGSDSSLINNGTIISENSTGVVVNAGGASYLNTGSIISRDDEGTAVNMFNAVGAGVDTLFHNSGLISGVTAFSGSLAGANETFWNSGANAQIIGDVDMGSGDDTFRNFSANSIHYDIHGGLGEDRLFGGSGTERFHGDDGDDYFELGGGDDIAYGGAGEDMVFAQGGSDTIYGGEGADIIHGNTGNDMLYGNAGSDSLYGGANNDTLSGGSESDDLFGSIGNDTLLGGSGNDELYGGPGTDALIGGAGLDLFYMLGFFGEDDVIVDFNQADNDIIVLSPGLAEGLNDVLLASTYVNGNTLVDFGTNQSFTIEGIRPAELMADDFVFDGVVV